MALPTRFSELHEFPPPARRGEPTWTVAKMYPAQGDWSEEDYWNLDPACGFELDEGMLVALPMPTHFHQYIVRYLFELLCQVAEGPSGGFVYFSPFVVKIAHRVVRLPDVVYCRRERITDVHKAPTGADLVMEVVSDDEESHDRDWNRKRQQYASVGITEYWIVDPQLRTICVLALVNGAYEVFQQAGDGGSVRSKLFPALEVDVTTALNAGKMPPKA